MTVQPVSAADVAPHRLAVLPPDGRVPESGTTFVSVPNGSWDIYGSEKESS